ncbi:MAG: MerR family transcriptional regulator [Bacteroidota bacterium]|nr:MerR family transcriptional regulator [Bacteroidota bacterium]
MGINTGLIEIPEDKILFQKQYYSIGDVAMMFKENTSLIRYWENEFSILKPRKNRKGDRFFRPEDVKNLKMIYHLLRERKYTIDGAKEFLKNNKAAGEKHEMIESLEKIKSFLLELKNNL